MLNIDEILREREKNYGNFDSGARTAMQLLNCLHCNEGFYYLSESSKFAITMILFKIARIVNGKTDGETHEDNWTDIAGYAELARLEAEKRNSAGEAE